MPTSIDAPDVTLVVIAFNEVFHAAECVQAVLAQQTSAHFDLVFVDDGSSDGTAEAASAAAGVDHRFRLIRLNPNRGRGAARAAGVAEARGHAIGFVDADITLPADWLDRCLAELPGHAAVGGIAVPDGNVATIAAVSRARPRPVHGSMPITGNNVLFDAAILREHGFDPRDRLGEDFRLSGRLLRGGFSLRRVPGLIVRHEERKSIRQAIRWRFENGVDASSHPRELRRLRFTDIVWFGWAAGWAVGIGGTITISPWWLFLCPMASGVVALVQVARGFYPRPLAQFIVAWILDVPMVTAYLLGRTIGTPRLLRARD